MPKITFIQRDGSRNEIDAPDGVSLLRLAHDNDIDLEGACGGSLACATCHLVIDEAWYDKLPPKSTAEEDMLDLAFSLTETSRLGCQIKVSDELDGMVVSLPEI
ncbi:MAG: fdxB [Alphaproteobacteria bacterium]|nr:fdxB [Alphaproteobacteria bacterium]